MANQSRKEQLLPSREFSYAYTVAMSFSQELEANLRAILYTADYHGWGTEIELDPEQLKRYKSSESFIDSATCGLLINKLEKTHLIKFRSDEWNKFRRACSHRNKLAHSFLANQNFNTLTKDQERKTIASLHEMTLDLYLALLISRAVRDRVELEADKIHERWRVMFREVEGTDYEDPDRHYATKERKKKNGG